MRPAQYTILLVLVILAGQFSLPAAGQLGFPLQIKKSEEYEDRVLRSERSDQGKFRLPKRFIQNTITHYNYFFNANNKLNEVLERAKTSFQDDYSKLLPFYNYTLEKTAQDSIQLDSIVYKASTGIALHDLRNDWIDNLYLLWGASYYLQKKFDSAYLMFQFINYAFAPKEKDGYYLTIGSSRDGNSAYSISTKEKNSLPKRILSEPPSRNEAFIWQIRNFLAQDQMAEAASLIVTLNNDPNFPKRLHPDLHEVQAYWFYKQNIWDSAAVHLVEALDNATNLQEKARWEYLAAQLFEMTGHNKEATKYYTKVSNQTTDLVLDIYARLAAVRVNRKQGENSIEKNVAELMRMAKRDKYEEYRDIIYYMAAQMQLEGKNIDEAIKLLQKSTEFTSNNPSQRNKAFLQLAEISYDRGEYRRAHDFYDSIRLDDQSPKETERIQARKKLLGTVVTQLDIAEKNDSLLRIAAMPEEERKEYVKKLVKDLRKQQGLKDDPSMQVAGPIVTAPTLFPSGQQKGEWYFYNAAFRAKGQSDFKAKWGNRPNIDNWRRTPGGAFNTQNNVGPNPNSTSGSATGNELTFEDLYANLPLTTEQIQKTNDSLQAAWFELGKLYIQQIEHCFTGTEVLERLRAKNPQYAKMDEVLFNLYYCYNKTGETAKAFEMKKLLNEKFPGSNYNTILTTGKNPTLTKSDEATKAYEDIYELFIEGNFSEALSRKKIADSLYGKSYWSPQLLYIEAIYYIKQREDSAAKKVLNVILNNFPKSPLEDKAKNLLDVLSKRSLIEAELTKLVVTRNEDAPTRPVTDNSVVKDPKPVNTNPNPVNTNPDPAKTNPVPVARNPKPDSTQGTKPVTMIGNFEVNPAGKHFVALVLNKVDPVFMNEAKNAFNRYHRETYASQNLQTELKEVDGENKLLIISAFTNGNEALNYIDQTNPRTSTQILPWLRGGKYSFLMFTETNLSQVLKLKDIVAYRNFLNQLYPGKFNP